VDLLTTGATGLKNCTVDSTEPPSACAEPDTRIANLDKLPNPVFEISGPKLPYDSHTADVVHRFSHMWQQSDCYLSFSTPSSPAGCLNDLYPFVGIVRGDDSGSNAMGFYNVEKGDAPLFKRLADKYTMSDNFHQSVMAAAVCSTPCSVPPTRSSGRRSIICLRSRRPHRSRIRLLRARPTTLM
jgi:hypothetical protein